MLLTITQDDRPLRVAAAHTPKGTWLCHKGHVVFVPKRARQAHGDAAEAADNEVLAPMTGKVVKVSVEPGAKVEAGATLLIMEAMKMEYRLTAPRACTVAQVHATAGELVDLGTVVVTLSP